MITSLRGSLFRTVKTNVPERVSLRWPEDFLRWHDVDGSVESNKLSVPLFSLVEYKPNKGREKKNSVANIAEVTGLVLDYDDDHGVTLERARQAWAGFEQVIHTTFSHMASPLKAHAFRIVLPFLASIAPEQAERFCAEWVADHAARAGAPLHKLSVAQLYFFPTRRTDADFGAQCAHYPGKVLDPFNLLDFDKPIAATVSKVRPTLAAASGGTASFDVSILDGIDASGFNCSLSVIETHCAFMRRAREHAATLPEPEWHSWLSVITRCENGRETAHQIGSAYPKYNRDETEYKIARVLEETAPHTCQTIADRSPACSACPLKGKITSPVSIHGFVRRLNADASTEDVAEALVPFRQLDEEIAAAEAAVLGQQQRVARIRIEMQKKKQDAKAIHRLDDKYQTEQLQYEIELNQAKTNLATAKSSLKRLRAREAEWKARQGADIAVMNMLAVDEKGRPYANHANVLTVLKEDPAYKDAFSFDTFSNDTLYLGRPAIDENDTAINVDLQDRYGMRSLDTRTVREVVALISQERPVHVVKDYLRGLKWDGRARLDTLMRMGFGALDTDTQNADYLADVGRKLCISAVARIEVPERKNEIVVVLTGSQGTFKSSSLAALVPQKSWFADSKLPLGNKDAFMQLDGVWIYEIAELDSFKKAENSQVKAFISSASDKYRAPFAHRTKHRYRSTVLVGSTNEPEFLNDPTGNRRYAPVKIGQADVAWLTKNRDRLWAEAVVRFDAGETWWYAGESAVRLRSQSEEFRDLDIWHGPVLNYLLQQKGDVFLQVHQVLTAALSVLPAQQKQGEKLRIAGIMKLLHLEYVQISRTDAIRLKIGGRPRGYWVTGKIRERLITGDLANVVPFSGGELHV